MPDVLVVDHPAAALQLAALRSTETRSDAFRAAARRLGVHLATAALDVVPTRETTVTTPLGDAPSVEPAHPIVAVPVLRAGLGLLEGVADVVPGLGVGMVGLARDHDTHEPIQYYRKVPSLAGRWVLLLEPMLATGGSAAAAAAQLAGDDIAGITVLSVVATEQALATVGSALPPDGVIVTAAIDPVLNDDAYIVPGLGDFGDRLYGT